MKKCWIIAGMDAIIMLVLLVLMYCTNTPQPGLYGGLSANVGLFFLFYILFHIALVVLVVVLLVIIIRKQKEEKI